METIKEIFKKSLDTGLVKGHIAGPKGNVLVCDSHKDWLKIGDELVDAGYDCYSPGGYGGGNPASRQATWVKIWQAGTVCATVIAKRVLIFHLPQSVNDQCDVIVKKGEKVPLEK